MNITLSEYRDSDRQRLLALWSEALPLDAITVSTLETRVLLDDNFDPGTFLLASEGERLAGFVLGITGRRLSLGDADPAGQRAWITAFGVRPGLDFAEVGCMLLGELENRFRALGKAECYVSTYPPGYFTPGVDRKFSAPLLQFLVSSGYHEVKQALSMDAQITLFEILGKTLEIEQRLASEGIVVRTYRPADLLRFLAFLDHSMPTDWVRVERANLRKMATGGFSPEQITVVAKEDEIIGYCQFEGSHFGPFGVADVYQGKGIGTVLLARTLERMRVNGYHDAWVMWTDDLAAKVYQKFGFKETRRFSILQKAL